MAKDAHLFKDVFNHLKNPERAFVFGWGMDDVLLTLARKTMRTGDLRTDSGPLFGGNEKSPFQEGRAFFCQEEGVLAVLQHTIRTQHGAHCNRKHFAVFDLKNGKMFTAGYDFYRKKPFGDKRPQPLDRAVFDKETAVLFEEYPVYKELCVPPVSLKNKMTSVLLLYGAMAGALVLTGLFYCNRDGIKRRSENSPLSPLPPSPRTILSTPVPSTRMASYARDSLLPSLPLP